MGRDHGVRRAIGAGRTFRSFFWVGIAFGLVGGSAAAAVPPEIPLVPRLGVGARALGMGGAYTAVADDYAALYYNPAGLAQIRRTEFGIGFDHRSVKSINTYLGNRESTPLDKTRIESLGFAYPFPTYRGSLVIGMAYHRVATFDQDYFRQGSGGEIVSESESIREDGSLGSYEAGFAWDLSPTLSVGAAGVILAGSSDRHRDFEYEGDNGIDFESTITQTHMDITAITGTLGAMVRFDPKVRLGMALHLPESFNLDGRILDDVIRYQADPVDTLDYVDEYSFKDDLSLPFRFSAGLSYASRGLLVSGDLTYADWKEIDYDGPIRNGRDYAYRATTDLRFGVEYALPTEPPVRIRAGFISQPLAYQLIATDVFYGVANKADLTWDNRYFTLGGGILLDRSLTLDLSYVFGGYKREGSSPVGRTVEEIKDRRLNLAATFRL